MTSTDELCLNIASKPMIPDGLVIQLYVENRGVFSVLRKARLVFEAHSPSHSPNVLTRQAFRDSHTIVDARFSRQEVIRFFGITLDWMIAANMA
jgi:hypothetical protein